MFDWIRKKYIALCERNEDMAARHKADRLALEAARKARADVDATIKRADKLLGDDKP